jgi:ATP-binding cassette subfamily C (CFTR/MRP) protein 1
MLSFITFSLSKHELDPAPIFSSLALFNSLRMPLMLLPMVISQVTDAWSSIGRIQEYLMAEEIRDEFTWNYEGRYAVETKDASFTWESTTTPDAKDTKRTKKQQKAAKNEEKRAAIAAKTAGTDRPENVGSDAVGSSAILTDQEPFKLNDLSFSIGRKELIAVIGRVGSGKSSLLAALAGDMRMARGEVTIGASRAFCPQYAWIQNATVKDNILFGKEYDAEWYSQVIEACALGPDLEMLPHGDLTEIGERGITVSGGQKQRMNIARAIYFGADIVLLDDPLSAVDAHVGRHIFDNAICGLLKDKCRILATHQLHVLSRCDRIIWLEDGKIEAIDTFTNLITHNEAFSNMMATISQEKKEGDGKDKDDVEDDIEDETKDLKKSKKKRGAALMQAEERATESVPWSVYRAYISASGSMLNAPLVLWFLILSQGANIATSLWLSWWTANKWHLSMGKYVRPHISTPVRRC